MIVNDRFLKTADALKPVLAQRLVKCGCDAPVLDQGASVIFDFREHLTGHVKLRFSYEGHHPDAPAWLCLRFAERIEELTENAEDYRGWISASWVQQEEIHVDVIPSEMTLPRRYAFRYLQAEVRAVSSRFLLKIEEVSCLALTSASEEQLLRADLRDPMLAAIDATAVRTLRECMQDVFEDGPKRDRRLWMGDLRLQALANYATYRNYDLVKRCLYLFAGALPEDGGMAACIFTEPAVEADDQYMFDYALLFTKVLQEYVEASGDEDALQDLWPTVKGQFAFAEKFFKEDGSFLEQKSPQWCFVDWNFTLDKQLSALGVWLYCAESAAALAAKIGDRTFLAGIEGKIADRRAAGQKSFDRTTGVFVSGPADQISMSSQVWAVLGGLTADGAVFDRAAALGACRMVSPYMYHYYAEALVRLGKKKEALAVIRSYWGGMVDKGADCFWELYDPEDPDGSPYGGTIVNSYCHAWSCTPAYFLRTVLKDVSSSLYSRISPA